MKLEAGRSMEGENSILAEAACIATHNHGNAICQYTLNRQDRRKDQLYDSFSQKCVFLPIPSSPGAGPSFAASTFYQIM